MKPKRTPRALVVDDDPWIAEILETLLRLRNFEVDVVTDGIHIIEPAVDYDVILLDLKMPVFDGERLANYWNMTRPELLKKVIVLSGYSHIAREWQLPTFATVVKPFDPMAVLQLIDACAAQSAAEDSA